MQFILGIVAWLVKNTALLVGIVEGLAKFIAGVVSLTPTKSDDWLVAKVDEIASTVKKILYVLSDKMAGKNETPA